MFRIVVSLALLILATAAASQDVSENSPAGSEIVWIWSSHCDSGAKVHIEVLLSGAVVHSSTIPICRGRRDAETQRKIRFTFKGGHTFQGKYHTKKTDLIEGNIWQAGGDPGDLVLGVAFFTKRRILLNTIRIVRPDKLSTMNIDRGIVVRTVPKITETGLSP